MQKGCLTYIGDAKSQISLSMCTDLECNSPSDRAADKREYGG